MTNFLGQSIRATQTYVDNQIAFYREPTMGVLSGGVLSINAGDATTFDVTAGTGRFDKIDVAWRAIVGETFNVTPTRVLTFVYVDDHGVIETSLTRSSAEIRTAIYLGALVHVDGVIIDVVNDQQVVASNPVAQLYDLMYAIGFINAGGNEIDPGFAGNLTIAKAAGTMLAAGSNYKNDPDNPHVVQLPALNTHTGSFFQYRYADGTSSDLTQTVLVPGLYDDIHNENGGGLQPVAPNSWQVQRVYSFTSNNLKIQPGQTTFGNVDDAYASITATRFTTEPSIRTNGLLVAYLVLRGAGTDAADTGDCIIVHASRVQTEVH